MGVALGQVLGHHRVDARLGRGGMGEVFAAHDSSLDRTVALKVLLPEVASDSKRLERFEREARDLARELQARKILEEHFLPTAVAPGRQRFRWGTLAGGAGAVLLALWVAFELASPAVEAPQAAAPPTIRSLAVLPFDNLMDDPEQDYFVEGINAPIFARSVISASSTSGSKPRTALRSDPRRPTLHRPAPPNRLSRVREAVRGNDACTRSGSRVFGAGIVALRAGAHPATTSTIAGGTGFSIRTTCRIFGALCCCRADRDRWLETTS